MELFLATMQTVLSLLRIEFTVLGFTFSLWQVFLFSIIGSAVAGAVSWFFFSD